MRDRINVEKAIFLYQFFKKWRLVAMQMRRPNGMPYATDAIVAAVRRHDRENYE